MFHSDDQRKAVMSNLNKRKRVSSHKIKTTTEDKIRQKTTNKMLFTDETIQLKTNQEISDKLIGTPHDQIGMGLSILYGKAVSKKLEIYYSEKASHLDPYSKHQLKDMLDLVLHQWDTAIGTFNWEEIIKNKKKKKEIVELTAIIKPVVKRYVDEAFGYDEPEKRPITPAEKSIAKLNEPYEQDKNDLFGFLGNARNIDHKLVKEIVNDYLLYLTNETMRSLPDEFL